MAGPEGLPWGVVSGLLLADGLGVADDWLPGEWVAE
jgi:hypothetical protein